MLHQKIDSYKDPEMNSVTIGSPLVNEHQNKNKQELTKKSITLHTLASTHNGGQISRRGQKMIITCKHIDFGPCSHCPHMNSTWSILPQLTHVTCHITLHVTSLLFNHHQETPQRDSSNFNYNIYGIHHLIHNGSRMRDHTAGRCKERPSNVASSHDITWLQLSPEWYHMTFNWVLDGITWPSIGLWM